MRIATAALRKNLRIMRTAEDASKAITAGFLEQKIQGGAMNLSSTFSLEKMVISGKPRLTIEVNKSSLTLQVPPAYTPRHARISVPLTDL
jgi:hypothetical protein